MSYHSRLSEKIMVAEKLLPILNAARLKDNKIVFTNGCFDILHRGHTEYLAKARDLGGVLVIGLNTDDSVRRQNKSPERPINNEEAMATSLSALEVVDFVCLFEEDHHD